MDAATRPLPGVFDLLGRSFDIFQKHWAGYLLVGLLCFVAQLAMVLVVMGVGAGAVVLGALSSGGGSELPVVLLAALGLVGTALFAAMYAGFVVVYLGGFREVLQAMRQDREPTIAGVIEQAQERPLSGVGTMVLLTAVGMLGMCLLVVPGIIAMLGLVLTLPAWADRDLDAIEALRYGFDALMARPGWVLLIGFIATLMMVVIGQIPILGSILAIPLYMLFAGSAYLAWEQPAVPASLAAAGATAAELESVQLELDRE